VVFVLRLVLGVGSVCVCVGSSSLVFHRNMQLLQSESSQFGHFTRWISVLVNVHARSVQSSGAVIGVYASLVLVWNCSRLTR
jgi:hypothetical protein